MSQVVLDTPLDALGLIEASAGTGKTYTLAGLFARAVIVERRAVPEVLASGNHAAIRRWRLMQALGRTWQKRPDLLAERGLSKDERALLEEYCRTAGVEPPH